MSMWCVEWRTACPVAGEMGEGAGEVGCGHFMLLYFPIRLPDNKYICV